MNKRGFIRTLEAIIAVIIVFVFIYYVGSSSDKEYRTLESIKTLQESILSEISKNDGFRDCIVNSQNIQEIKNNGKECPEIGKFIEDNLPTRFKTRYRFNVCDPNQMKTCSLPSIEGGEVYTSAVVITSSLGSKTYSPRILRLWLY